MKLSQLKKYWIVVFSNGNVAYWSIASTKRQCIENYLAGISFVGDSASYWRQAQRRGAQCLRVNITFQPVTPAQKKLNPSDATDWYADPGASGKVDL